MFEGAGVCGRGTRGGDDDRVAVAVPGCRYVDVRAAKTTLAKIAAVPDSASHRSAHSHEAAGDRPPSGACGVNSVFDVC